ncbi:Histone acetyltransferase KAT6A [Trichoplax sp. H2]|nr:Histone acetyltransferase KAT6A [Trichoplax sp. H2]|eukprot:RDD47832.1 Histone acetyltransferase KAT6A [Trichoplax sp. H2]
MATIASNMEERKSTPNSNLISNLTFSEVKNCIEEAITTLVKRKARADDDNIIKMLQKRFRIPAQTTIKILSKLVADGKIRKDSSRSGGVKYRIANRIKPRKKRSSSSANNDRPPNPKASSKSYEHHHSSNNHDNVASSNLRRKGYVINTAELTRMIYNCLVSCPNPDVGVHLRSIEKYISSHYQGVLLRKHVKMALKRAINSGKIQKIDKLYYRINPEVVSTLELDDLVLTFIANNPSGVFFKEIVKEVSNEHSGALLARYIRRSLDQAIQNKLVMKNKDNRYVIIEKQAANIINKNVQISNQDQGDKCYLCLQVSSPILDDQGDVIIFCSDCRRKVHPSCLGYNYHLIAKILASDKWQCNDCKICFVCQEAGRPDSLLLCDACDKGCHMECTDPPLSETPKVMKAYVLKIGQWICHCCRRDDTYEESGLSTSYNNVSNYGNATNGGYCTESSPSAMYKSKKLISRRIIEKLTDAIQDLPNPLEWKVSDVALVFQKLGFAEFSHVFLVQEIDGKALFLLNRSDVISALGLKLGPALKIFSYIDILQSSMKASGITLY